MSQQKKAAHLRYPAKQKNNQSGHYSRFKPDENQGNKKLNLKGAFDKPNKKFVNNRNLSNHSGNARLNSRPALLGK